MMAVAVAAVLLGMARASPWLALLVMIGALVLLPAHYLALRFAGSDAGPGQGPRDANYQALFIGFAGVFWMTFVVVVQVVARLLLR
jgi:hypothetical protein